MKRLLIFLLVIYRSCSPVEVYNRCDEEMFGYILVTNESNFDIRITLRTEDSSDLVTYIRPENDLESNKSVTIECPEGYINLWAGPWNETIADFDIYLVDYSDIGVLNRCESFEYHYLQPYVPEDPLIGVWTGSQGFLFRENGVGARDLLNDGFWDAMSWSTSSDTLSVWREWVLPEIDDRFIYQVVEHTLYLTNLKDTDSTNTYHRVSY